jgi:hypothetical protein
MPKIKYTFIRNSDNKITNEQIFEKEDGDKWRDFIISRNIVGDEGTYTVEEEDVTQELEDKEALKQEKKDKKDLAAVTLSDIKSLDLTKKEDIELAITSIVEFLELEVN